MKLSEELIARGFIHQITSESLSEIVDGEPRTVYHGFDPTAESIHAGNFVQFMLLRHLAKAGHKIIVLIGGGTGMIGDPKPDVERPLTPPEVIQERVEKLRAQVEPLLGTDVTFVNNHDWLGALNLIEFLRETGKHFTVNELIKKDAIANRLSTEQGLSYTEFAYPLLQAYDYLKLHEEYGCDLQTGGSDQWGNIVAGVDLVRKKVQKTVYAITVPLVVDKATGKKFGKSEGNAVWLDPSMTSPYQFYQFWLNTNDESVIDYLKLFTFIELEEIASLEQVFAMNPGERVAQKRLAEAVTSLVHGELVATSVAKVSGILFGETTLSDLTKEEQQTLLENAPTTEVQTGAILVDVLVTTGLASSKREARTFMESGAVTLSGEKVLDTEAVLAPTHFIDNLAVLKRGKKQLCVLRLV